MKSSLEAQAMIPTERVQRLTDHTGQSGKYVIYWMQASQREEYNHALEFAVQHANRLNVPPLVVFGITGEYPEANARHYKFMLEGLQETQQKLRERGIQMAIRYQSPERVAIEFSRRAVLMVTDRGYTRIQRQWRREVAGNIDCPLFQVESDVVVPVEEVTLKREYAARTIRPKIHRHLDKFLHPVTREEVRNPSVGPSIRSADISDISAVLHALDVDRSVTPTEHFRGGTSRARDLLNTFIAKKLDRYDIDRNNPVEDALSRMSPYLRFGQISPLYIAGKILETESPGKDPYLEELIVRRELSVNFCYYTENYDEFSCLPQWAGVTLSEHAEDTREYMYSPGEFERAETHDPYWNAAQMEMVLTGKMHGYMRMYWGKKILEWTEHPGRAYDIALYLNNKYELDGRDPNGYAGVAWCFGNHDQGWKERPVYGKVRYMNANGLKRKFDADGYVEKIQLLM